MTETTAKVAQRDPLSDTALDHAHKDFAGVSIHDTAAQSLESVRTSGLSSRIVYFYAIDEERRLRGVVPVRRLLLSDPDTPVADLMVRRVVSLPAGATLLDACEMFIQHRLLALPITDAQKRIVGVIDVDQYTDEIRELDDREESNDIFQLIGVRIAQLRRGNLPALFRSRFPWLLCNVAGGIACAAIAWLFEGVLDQVIALALFIPVVLALAESVSIQSLTLALQMPHGRGVRVGEMLRTVWWEFPLGMMLGGACGALVGGVAWLWHGDGGVAVCLLLGISLSVMLAAVFGLAVPTTLLRIQRDPKVASGPITLALTDVTTLAVYLGVSTAWLL